MAEIKLNNCSDFNCTNMIPDFDKNHQELTDIFDDLCRTIDEGSVEEKLRKIQNLLDFAKKSFAVKEYDIKKSDYLSFAVQKLEHARLLQKISEIKLRVINHGFITKREIFETFRLWRQQYSL